MTKANELRVGNKMVVNSKVVTVVEIGMRGTLREGYRVIKFDEFLGGSFCKNVHAVPLTPEILINSGWKKSKSDIDTWYKKGWIISKDANGKLFTVKGDKVILKTVHQLQNLYFAFTFEELKINL